MSEISNRKKRSTKNRGPMSEETYHLLCDALRGNPNSDERVSQYLENNISFIYENSCKDRPKFLFDDTISVLYKLEGNSRKQVVYGSKAREIVQNIHRPSGRACRKGGVRKVMAEFQSHYYCKGIEHIVRETLRECSGTCNRLRVLKTRKAPPKLIRSYSVMERVQIDLIEMYGPKSPFKDEAKHNYHFILTVLDTFSKYCWLYPLPEKKAVNVANALKHIFVDYGCPMYLQSDNGKEFTANVVRHLCSVMNIKEIHGSPYHPQSQGQVESLNKKVKSTLKFRLLDFPAEEQKDVWPFLLPEISQNLNNTWHVTLKCTPFQVFFGRDSRHFQDESGSCLTVLPSDQFLLFMTSSDCSVKYDDSPTDQAVAHEEQNTLADDMLAALYDTAQTRLQYYLRVRENTESKYYQNYLAYIKKTKTRKYSCGEKVYFRCPEQHGLVLLPNREGIVTDVLPCDYYRVSFKLGSGEDASTVLYSSMMEGVHGDVPSDVAEGEVVKDDFVSQLKHFAVTLREAVKPLISKEVLPENDCSCGHSSSNQAYSPAQPLSSFHTGMSSWEHPCSEQEKICEKQTSSKHTHTEGLCENDLEQHDLMQAVFDLMGLQLCEPPNPSTMLDLFCFSCDFGFLTVTTKDRQFSNLCSKYSNAILSYLQRQQFQHYLSGIHAWESSRVNIQVNLKQSLSQRILPFYVAASHTCLDCVSGMCPCSHPCCRRWYIKAGLKCGFIQESEQDGVIQFVTTCAEGKLLSTIPVEDPIAEHEVASSNVPSVLENPLLESDVDGSSMSSVLEHPISEPVVGSTGVRQLFSSPLPASRKRAKGTRNGPRGPSVKKSKKALSTCPSTPTTTCKNKSTKGAQKKAESATKNSKSSQLTTNAIKGSPQSHFLRGTVNLDADIFYKRKSPSVYPMTLSLRRLQAVLSKLVDVGAQLFVQKCSILLKSWKQLTNIERNNLSLNIRYAFSVVHSKPNVPSLKVVQRKGKPFLQQQADSNMCGLCALNNLYQGDKFSVTDINGIADALWYSHWSDLNMNPTESVQSMRSSIGDYTIDVIIAAVTESGDQLHNLTANIRNFMQAHGSGHYLFSTPEILCNSIVTPGKQFPHMLLIKHVTYHYTCLQIHNNGSVWWLDSRKSEPVSLSLLHLHSILKKEFLKSDTSAALFILEQSACNVTCTTQSCSAALNSAGNEDTPVVVDDVNAGEGTGENSDVNADEGAGESSDERALTLRLSTGGEHNLTTGDIREIASGMWLNDKVVNFYLQLLNLEECERIEKLPLVRKAFAKKVVCVSSLFYESVQLWKRGEKSFEQVAAYIKELTSIRKLIIPICCGYHWILLVFDMENKAIFSYDSSMGDETSPYTPKMTLIGEVLTLLYKNLGYTHENPCKWRMQARLNLPQQQNSDDCGVFACKFAACLARRVKTTFEPTQGIIRLWLLKEIMMSTVKKPQYIQAGSGYQKLMAKLNTYGDFNSSPVKDCDDVERLDAQSGSDTDSSSDNGCLLEETKQDIPLLIPEFSENAMAVPTNEQIFHFTNPQSSYIRTMQLLVSSDQGPPQQDGDIPRIAIHTALKHAEAHLRLLAAQPMRSPYGYIQHSQEATIHSGWEWLPEADGEVEHIW